MSEIKLGDLARDKITGYEGIVISRTEWLNGCVRLGLQAKKMKDGLPLADAVFDVGQLVLVKAGAFDRKPKPTGGPYPKRSMARDPR